MKARGTWDPRLVGQVLGVGVALSAMPGFGASSAMAAPPVVGTELDANAEERFLVEQLTADKAIAVARERRLADADQEALYERLGEKDRKLRKAEERAKGNEAALAKVRRQRDAIANERRALVDALAERDRSLAAEVRVFREQITQSVMSPDPRVRAELQRFADGEQREAVAVLKVIRLANRKARKKAAELAEAAEARLEAWLTDLGRDEGKFSLDEVIRMYEEITQLDPDFTWDWIELARLYQEAGRLHDARNAAKSALESLGTGGDPRDRSVVLDELGDVAVKAGNLADAKARFEEALVIAKKLAKDDPSSAAAQRDLSISLDKLGDVAVQAGNLADAKARFEEGLVIAKKLAKDDPSSAAAQRDLSISLNKLGDVAVKAGNLADAKARFEDALVIRKKLAKDDPSSSAAQRDLSISLNNLGDVAVQAGNLADAKARFEDALVISKKLAKDDPSSAAAQRDLIVSLVKLGAVTNDRDLLTDALALVRKLDAEGRLAPTDQKWLELLPQIIDSLP